MRVYDHHYSILSLEGFRDKLNTRTNRRIYKQYILLLLLLLLLYSLYAFGRKFTLHRRYIPTLVCRIVFGSWGMRRYAQTGNWFLDALHHNVSENGKKKYHFFRLFIYYRGVMYVIIRNNIIVGTFLSIRFVFDVPLTCSNQR